VDNIIFCVFSLADLHVYRAMLPVYFDVYFDEALDDFVLARQPAEACLVADRAASRMTVITDSVSYTRPSYDNAGDFSVINVLADAFDFQHLRGRSPS
jgi:hypothetical protein